MTPHRFRLSWHCMYSSRRSKRLCPLYFNHIRIHWIEPWPCSFGFGSEPSWRAGASVGGHGFGCWIISDGAHCTLGFLLDCGPMWSCDSSWQPRGQGQISGEWLQSHRYDKFSFSWLSSTFFLELQNTAASSLYRRQLWDRLAVWLPRTF